MSENAYYGNPNSTPARQLRRSRSDRVAAGLCAGAARHFGMDVNLLRFLLVIATIFSAGTGLLIYLAGWVLIPEED